MRHLGKYTKATQPKVTEVYDTYWRFAAERQEIFFRRFHGGDYPWTYDDALKVNKFTNAYRASDRVSQYLIKRVIYSGENQSEEDVLFRIILFKLFNKIETWELLERKLGQITINDYNYSNYDRILTKAMDEGKSIYSGAYIMPSGSKLFGVRKKHRAHLQLLELMFKGRIVSEVMKCNSMESVYKVLLTYPMIGEFLAYQYATDLNYSELTDFDEMEFVFPGPGARDGMRKCFASFGEYSPSDLIKYVTERQGEEFASRGIDFKTLWGRELQLIDCQNIFCEVDKYARVVHPDVVGLTGRKRIKQKFRASSKKISYWYPPKWKLNETIAEDRS